MTRACLIPSLVVWLLALMAGGTVRAEETNVDPPATPTEVKVGVYVVDLISVDGASQTFEADIVVRIAWNDPRLASEAQGTRRMPLDDVWYPRILVTNVRSSDVRLPEVVEVSANGDVVYRQRTISTYAAPLDLRNFPHDRQKLFIQLVAAGHDPGTVEFVTDDELSGSTGEFSITDWEVGEFGLTIAPYQVPQIGRQLPGLRLEAEVVRLTEYYVGTIFATVAIIALMAWLVYWLPVNAVNPRVSISVTSMLALIAYRFVASQDLPRLPYLTRMDYFLFGAALLILLGLVTVVAVAHSEAQGRSERAQKLNLYFRWGYPIALAALLLTLGTG